MPSSLLATDVCSSMCLSPAAGVLKHTQAVSQEWDQPKGEPKEMEGGQQRQHPSRPSNTCCASWLLLSSCYRRREVVGMEYPSGTENSDHCPVLVSS